MESLAWYLSRVSLSSAALLHNFSLTGTNLQEPLFFIYQYSKIQLVLLPSLPWSPRSSKVWQGFLTMTLNLFFSISTSSLKFLSQLKSPRNCRHLTGASSYSLKWVAWACLVLEDQNITAVMFDCSQILGTTSYVATCARALPLYTFSCRWEQFCLLCREGNHRFLGTDCCCQFLRGGSCPIK